MIQISVFQFVMLVIMSALGVGQSSWILLTIFFKLADPDERRASYQKAEIARLKRGDFTEEEFQNLCHNFDEEDECAFKAGCEAYQAKLFGSKKDAFRS